MHTYLYTIPKAAAALGIGRSKLYQLLSSGEITSVKVGSRRMIPPSSMATFVGSLPVEDGLDRAIADYS